MTHSAETYWGATALPGPVAGDRSPAGWAAAIRAGDESAFNAFYDHYADRVYRYLFAILPGEEALVRDAFQETMLRVVRYIKPMPDENAQWAWLTRVARTALYDQLRRARRRAAREGAQATEPRPDAWPDDQETDERLRTALRSALETLDPNDRNLIEAYYFRGKSQADIGADTQTTRKAVESRLARIRTGLRQTLQEMLRHDA